MTMQEIFGEPIYVYTRQQAIEDGVLVDVTEWAGSGPNGMMGGFTVPVAMTAAVWALCQPPRNSIEDVRGRAHDVLWMARLAVHVHLKRACSDPEPHLPFTVRIGRKNYRLIVAFSGHEGFTIGLPEDF